MEPNNDAQQTAKRRNKKHRSKTPSLASNLPSDILSLIYCLLAAEDVLRFATVHFCCSHSPHFYTIRISPEEVEFGPFILYVFLLNRCAAYKDLFSVVPSVPFSAALISKYWNKTAMNDMIWKVRIPSDARLLKYLASRS
jgi:hypothetical protein